MKKFKRLIVLSSFAFMPCFTIANQTPDVTEYMTEPDIQSIEASVLDADQKFVSSLFEAYLDSIKLLGQHDPFAIQLRQRVIFNTNSAVLITEINILKLRELLSQVTDMADEETVEFLLTLWQHLDEQLKENPPPSEQVYLNIQPPGGDPMLPGINPTEISDPNLREQYENAILENESNALISRRSVVARRVHGRFVIEASIVLKQIGRTMSPEQRGVLTNNLRVYNLAGAERLLMSLSALNE